MFIKRKKSKISDVESDILKYKNKISIIENSVSIYDSFGVSFIDSELYRICSDVDMELLNSDRTDINYIEDLKKHYKYLTIRMSKWFEYYNTSMNIVSNYNKIDSTIIKYSSSYDKADKIRHNLCLTKRSDNLLNMDVPDKDYLISDMRQAISESYNALRIDIDLSISLYKKYVEIKDVLDLYISDINELSIRYNSDDKFIKEYIVDIDMDDPESVFNVVSDIVEGCDNSIINDWNKLVDDIFDFKNDHSKDNYDSIQLSDRLHAIMGSLFRMKSRASIYKHDISRKIKK